MFDVDDGPVKKIRVAELQPGKTRVVLEVDRSCYYVASLLADPPRFFFFQAADGIRARTVTGVQTCALPISIESPDNSVTWPLGNSARPVSSAAIETRSEERRVGKECRSRWTPQHEKKKMNGGREEMHADEERIRGTAPRDVQTYDVYSLMSVAELAFFFFFKQKTAYEIVR